MKRTAGMCKVVENCLVVVWRDSDRRIIKQGKRVGKSCPITQEEARAYVKGGPASAIRLIRARTGLGVLDCWKLVVTAKNSAW